MGRTVAKASMHVAAYCQAHDKVPGPQGWYAATIRGFYRW